MSEFVIYMQLYTIHRSKNPRGRKIIIFLPLKLYTAVAVEYKPFLVRFTPKAGRDGKKISIFWAILQKLS